ncbi:MAG: hypothetical protein KAR11_07800, partial [Phycisphaerae bacterium]|nr:hypothetical protein [Phycisphaerae bacterium]
EKVRNRTDKHCDEYHNPYGATNIKSAGLSVLQTGFLWYKLGVFERSTPEDFGRFCYKIWGNKSLCFVEWEEYYVRTWCFN